MSPVAAGGVVACCDCGASVTGDADQARHSADCATYTTTGPDVINVTWRNGAYYVDRPNWCGGKVVLAIDYAIARQALTAAQAEADRLRKLLDDAPSGETKGFAYGAETDGLIGGVVWMKAPYIPAGTYKLVCIDTPAGGREGL